MTSRKYTGSVGYIGLGDMGGGIATRLAQVGTDLIVFDLKTEAVDALVAKGARGASSLGELVRASDVILICVDPEPAVLKVIDGVLEFLRPGHTVIVQSSVPPQDVIAAAEKVAAAGGTLFDAPVSGSYEDRLNGTLAVPTGAKRGEIGDLATLLETIGRPIYLNALGGGEVAKLANNAVSSVTRAAVMEIIGMAQAYGIAEADLLEVLKAGSASSFVVQNWSFFDELARAGHIVSKQPKQAAEIVRMLRDKNLQLPIIEAHFEPLKTLDRQRYKQLTGREFDEANA